jgi:hypothetical protein
MRYRTLGSRLCLILALGITSTVLTAASPPSGQSLKLAMRKLWEDHITWTRVFIISALADLPDKAAATDRLLQNQVDIGNAIKPFYGDAAGTKLTGLLKDHIVIAADIVAAAKGGDTEKLNASKAKWTANADEIASFLSAANPKNWPAPEMKAMMRDHLAATTAELEARLNKDWAADVKAYDRVHDQIVSMSDALSDGIIKQFPAKV